MGHARKVTAAAAVLLLLFCLAPATYAYDIGSLHPEDSPVWDGIRSWQEQIRDLYEAARTAGIGLAAAAVAVSAVRYLTSSEQDAQRALRRAGWAVAALIALYLLPLITSTAIDRFSDYAWDPSAGIALNDTTLTPLAEEAGDAEPDG